MKTKALFFVTVFLALSLAGFATVYTVSNNSSGGSQYSSLLAAYNGAVNGDTLIMEGTNIAYSLPHYFHWNKSLTVIGAGFNTDKQLFKKTIITEGQDWWLYFELASGSAGSSFYGIAFSSPVDFVENASNITFENCEFQQSLRTNNVNCNNLIIRNCIFNPDNGENINLPSTASSNILLINCVFDGYIVGNNNTTSNLIIENCLFLSTYTGDLLPGINNASISNCIFMNKFPSGTTNCIYLNNICRVAGTLPPNGNTGSGNIENADPQLVSYAFDTFYDPTHDYDILAGSPCELTGSDGTDIGIHGGTSKFSEQGEPLIAPVVRSVEINNTVVAPNGTLSVDVSASKPAED